MSENLVEVVSRHMNANGGDGLFVTPIDGLFLMRWAEPGIPAHIIYRPALCLVVQGGKSISVGKKVLDYTAMQALIVSVELPAFGRVTQASAEQPFLGVTVEFDISVMREVMQELDAPPKPNGNAGLGVFVSDCDGPLADCVLRLIRLLDTPHAIAVLQRAIMREICFWLLTGPHAGEVCKIALPSSLTVS